MRGIPVREVRYLIAWSLEERGGGGGGEGRGGGGEVGRGGDQIYFVKARPRYCVFSKGWAWGEPGACVAGMGILLAVIQGIPDILMATL